MKPVSTEIYDSVKSAILKGTLVFEVDAFKTGARDTRILFTCLAKPTGLSCPSYVVAMEIGNTWLLSHWLSPEIHARIKKLPTPSCDNVPKDLILPAVTQCGMANIPDSLREAAERVYGLNNTHGSLVRRIETLKDTNARHRANN